MPDYGRDIQFGLFLVPDAGALDASTDLVQQAEELGFDLIGIQDHPYQRRFFDTLALTAHLAAYTERITFFTDVVCLPLRPPAVLAKTAVSLDVLSGGRFELGLGAGAFWDAIEGFGGPRRSPPEALQALAEAITVIRMLWSGDRGLRFDGDFYRLDGVHSGPTPVHDMGIWLGVGGTRALELVGRTADGWIPSLPTMPVDGLEAKQAIIDDAATSAGREPSEIRRVANVNGSITNGASEGFLHGPADQWVDELCGLALDLGFDSFVLWSQGDLKSQAAEFAGIAAEVRRVVSTTRG